MRETNKDTNLTTGHRPGTVALKTGDTDSLAGLIQCSRYAFGPNRLHYCGPDKSHEVYSYMKEGAGDMGLGFILKEFKTLYPYLRLISETNGIKNPFDIRVVEAYWIGNPLLGAVAKKKFYRDLLEAHEMPQKIGKKSFEAVAEKISLGAVPHHSFHVLNIWKRTGHFEREHTLESMDQCRISWGKVIGVDGPFINVLSPPLLRTAGKLSLGEAAPKKIIRSLESFGDIADVSVGDIISIHWGIPCEVLTPRQVAFLKKYTLQSIALANKAVEL